MNETPHISALQLQDAYAVIRGFAFALANGRVYGLEHKVALQSVADATRALRTFQQRYGDLTLNISGTEFQSEGKPLGPVLTTITDLAKRLANLNAQTLTFQNGITDAEVQTFVRMLFLRDDEVQQADGFAGLLSASGLSHIQTVNYSYQRVTEEEAVVAKDTSAKSILDTAAAAAISDMLGSDVLDTEGSRTLLKADLGNEHILAELVRLAVPPASVDHEGAEALTQQTVERLQRMSDRLLDVPANRTQKGRKAIKTIITTVESEITNRLQSLGADIQAMEALATRVKELIEDLAIDGLVAQYMKLRVNVATKEKQLKRHLKRAERRGAGTEELKGKLASIGFPAAVLASLSAGAFGDSSGTAAESTTRSSSSSSSSAGAAQVAPPPAEKPHVPETPLAELLKKLQNATPGDGTLPQLVEQILAEMKKTLQQAVTRAAEQMEVLKRITMIPAGRPDNADLSRRQLLVLMAELGQEMRQSLTVVMGAITILLGHRLGDISNEQKPLLEMAAESSRVLDDLINRMIHIAGMPSSLTPDAEVLARIKTAIGTP